MIKTNIYRANFFIFANMVNSINFRIVICDRPTLLEESLCIIFIFGLSHLLLYHIFLTQRIGTNNSVFFIWKVQIDAYYKCSV